MEYVYASAYLCFCVCALAHVHVYLYNCLCMQMCVCVCANVVCVCLCVRGMVYVCEYCMHIKKKKKRRSWDESGAAHVETLSAETVSMRSIMRQG